MYKLKQVGVEIIRLGATLDFTLSYSCRRLKLPVKFWYVLDCQRQPDHQYDSCIQIPPFEPLLRFKIFNQAAQRTPQAMVKLLEGDSK